jgi:hypothetical protein
MVRHSLQIRSLHTCKYFCLTCLILFVGRSNAEPLLDKEDTESDTPIPNRMVTQDDDTQTLRPITGASSIVDWAEQNVGDTRACPRKDKGKKTKTTNEPVLGSDESTPSLDEGRSPPYQEFNLSTSASFDDEDGDGGG